MIESLKPFKRLSKWETFFIINPEKIDEKEQILEKINQIIRSKEGEILKIEEWGLRKLAYPIQKKTRGYYILIEFYGSVDLPKELEEFFRVDERILRFIIVRLEKKYISEQPEQIQLT